MRIQNKGWSSGETFIVKDRVHEVVGYYTGTKDYSEMFTKVPVEGTTYVFYTCWDNTFPMYWTLKETSDLTELDLVCRLFHKGDKGR